MINLEVFFYNHFDTERISDDKLDLFTQDHLERLRANNPSNVYDVMIAATQKAYTDYYSAKTTESFELAQKEASTINVDTYAKEFQKLVSMKEGIIRGTWGIESSVYQEFYPNGLTEYSNAIRANMNELMDRYLQTATKHTAELPAGFVEAFTDIINNYKTHRQAQLNQMGTVSGDKLATSENRDALETQLMSNLLVIANNNIAKPAATKVYFSQHFVERTNHSATDDNTIKGTIEQEQILELWYDNFDNTTEFSFKNTGETRLQFYTALLPSDPIPETFLEIQAGETATALAFELGAADNKYLMVYNPNVEAEGSYEVSK